MAVVISWNSKRLQRGSWVTRKHFMSLSFSFMFPERSLLSSPLGISFLWQDLGLYRYGGATGAARAGASCRWPGTLSPLLSAPSCLSWLPSHSRSNPKPNINSEVVKTHDAWMAQWSGLSVPCYRRDVASPPRRWRRWRSYPALRPPDRHPKN